MVALVTAVLLYSAGFVFLYGVIRLAVRHGIQDVNRIRHDELLAERRAELQERTFIQDNAYLAGG
ncbi:hypothetical protein ACFFWC_03915 [Plantactinospora siamensis]|uniref:Uncharacterized protein n=1 Tax=Plantactinospora siamensis TaxID=555372 RepID=A0ABV6NQV6_9ACTN